MTDQPPVRPWIELADAALCAECDALYSIRAREGQLSSEASRCPRCTNKSRIVMSRLIEPIGRN